MSFHVDKDPNGLGNGDLAVRTDKGRLVTLIYAQTTRDTREVAEVVAAALNAAYSPSMTDMMVPPEQLGWIVENPMTLSLAAEAMAESIEAWMDPMNSTYLEGMREALAAYRALCAPPPSLHANSRIIT